MGDNKEKGIIEKLGILSVSRYKCSDYWQNYQICDADETEKVEEQRDVLLEALVNIYRYLNDVNFVPEKEILQYSGEAIQKVTGKQIKELL